MPRGSDELDQESELCRQMSARIAKAMAPFVAQLLDAEERRDAKAMQAVFNLAFASVVGSTLATLILYPHHNKGQWIDKPEANDMVKEILDTCLAAAKHQGRKMIDFYVAKRRRSR